MRDVAQDQSALELLRVQRSRLADRMRPPWWYLVGVALLWAVVFASPISSHYLAWRLSSWPIMVAGLAVVCLLQWGLSRATGIKLGFRNRRYPSSGRPAAIAMIVVGLAAGETETSLIHRGLLAAAIVVAVLAVAAEVALQQALLRGVRQDLRAGDGTT